MDPITAGLGIVGLGLQIFGGMKSSEEAQRQSQISQQNFKLENDVNSQRRTAMELSAHRQSLENYRNTQRKSALGLTTAVGQGAQFGSGLAGGLSQVTSQGAFNEQGISQNLTLGRNIFGINDQINTNKAMISQSQADQATDQGISSLGGSLVKNAGTISNIAGFGKAQLGSIGTGSISDYTSGGVNYASLQTGGIGSA